MKIGSKACCVGVVFLLASLGVGCSSPEETAPPSGGAVGGKADHGQGHDNVYELIAERYPNVLSLNQVIKSFDRQSNLEQFVQRLQALVKQSLGLELELPDIPTIAANPELFTNKLQFGLDDIDRGRQALLRGSIPLEKATMSSNQLPQVFDYAKAAEANLKLPMAEMKELIPGAVYQGWPINEDFPADQCKANMVFAEVIERLSANLNLPQEQQFTVIYNGQRFQKLDSFLQALRDAGHQLTAEVKHMVANFTGLNAKGADGQIHPVAAALFNRTEILDAQGNEAVMPMLHSEIVFHLTPKNVSGAPALRASAQFYQGVERIGLYGDGCRKSEDWVGLKVSDQFDNQQAARALELVGVFIDVIRTAAQKKNLAIHGYAVLGVCNDSVAIIQQAVRGWISSYPLFMIDELVLEELDGRIAAASAASGDAAALLDEYQTLRDAVVSSPSDAALNPTVHERIERSLPWESGKEPFRSTEDARRILSGR